MKADRQRTDGRDGRHCGPGKSKLSSLLPRLLATATAAAVVVVVARGLEGSFMCENVMNIALIANHGQENVLSANTTMTTIAPTMTRMNDNFT